MSLTGVQEFSVLLEKWGSPRVGGAGGVPWCKETFSCYLCVVAMEEITSPIFPFSLASIRCLDLVLVLARGKNLPCYILMGLHMGLTKNGM